MKNQALEVIKRRRSVRSFRPQQIAEAQLAAVLEAGRCAPCAGDAPHITAVQNAGLIADINAAAKEAAQGMGMPHLGQLGSNPDFVGSYGAPTMIIISDKAEAVAPQLNCAAAAQNMLIAAEALELGACWVHFPLFFMYGARAGALCAALGLPDGSKPYACIALGHKGEAAAPGRREYAEVTIIQ